MECYKYNIINLVTALYADENIVYFNEDSSDAIFFCNQIGILSIDINNINFGGTNYEKDDTETNIHIRFWPWQDSF